MLSCTLWSVIYLPLPRYRFPRRTVVKDYLKLLSMFCSAMPNRLSPQHVYQQELASASLCGPYPVHASRRKNFCV